ncbi:hypothetical protein ACQPUY_14640 [Clostridium nigeriense]
MCKFREQYFRDESIVLEENDFKNFWHKSVKNITIYNPLILK